MFNNLSPYGSTNQDNFEIFILQLSEWTRPMKHMTVHSHKNIVKGKHSSTTGGRAKLYSSCEISVNVSQETGNRTK